MSAETGIEAEVVEAPVIETTEVATESETPEQKASRDEKGRFKNPLQPRIDELTRARREAEREGQYWRQRAEAKEEAEAKANAPKKPEPKDFTDYNEYVEALTDYKADTKIDSKLEEREKKTAEQQKQEAANKSWNDRLSAAKAKVADFDEVVSSSNVEIADHVGEAIRDSEMGGDLLYHLAKNPDIAERLNKLPARAADREIGRIEAQLASSATPEPEVTEVEEIPVPVVKKTTSAPPPAKPIASARSLSTAPEKMGMDEYMATRRKQGARWAR